MQTSHPAARPITIGKHATELTGGIARQDSVRFATDTFTAGSVGGVRAMKLNTRMGSTYISMPRIRRQTTWMHLGWRAVAFASPLPAVQWTLVKPPMLNLALIVLTRSSYSEVA